MIARYTIATDRLYNCPRYGVQEVRCHWPQGGLALVQELPCKECMSSPERPRCLQHPYYQHGCYEEADVQVHTFSCLCPYFEGWKCTMTGSRINCSCVLYLCECAGQRPELWGLGHLWDTGAAQASTLADRSNACQEACTLLITPPSPCRCVCACCRYHSNR